MYLTNLTSTCFAASVSLYILPFDALSHSNQSLLKSVSHIHEPSSYSQACLHPCWQEAMAQEFEALEANHIWEVMELPRRKSTLLANEFIRLNTMLMVVWKGLRPAWLLEEILKEREFTMLRPYP